MFDVSYIVGRSGRDWVVADEDRVVLETITHERGSWHLISNPRRRFKNLDGAIRAAVEIHGLQKATNPRNILRNIRITAVTAPVDTGLLMVWVDGFHAMFAEQKLADSLYAARGLPVDLKLKRMSEPGTRWIESVTPSEVRR